MARTPTPASRLYTLEQAAELLAVSPKTIRRLIAKGELRGTDVGVGEAIQWRVSEREIARFQNRRTDGGLA